MENIIVGIFDSVDRCSNSIIRISNMDHKEYISIIGLERQDEQVKEAHIDILEDGEIIEEPYTGALSGVLGNFIDSFIFIKNYTYGNLFLTGRIGDMIAASKPFKDESPNNLAIAFNDIGFEQASAESLANLVITGQILVFVTINKNNKKKIREIFEESGALEVDYLKNEMLV